MGGSAKPKRRRAAGAALGYEHVRRRPSAWTQAKEKASRGDAWFGCLAVVIITAVLVGFALTVMTWGVDLWGRVAPAVPGGGYGFAAFVGALLPVGLTVAIGSLARTEWKARPLRSLGWTIVSLLGFAAVFVWAVVVFAVFRPRYRRNWDFGCYSRGNPCWIHVEYPWVWTVGLLSTVLVAAALITAAVRITKARGTTAAGTGKALEETSAG